MCVDCRRRRRRAINQEKYAGSFSVRTATAQGREKKQLRRMGAGQVECVCVCFTISEKVLLRAATMNHTTIRTKENREETLFPDVE